MLTSYWWCPSSSDIPELGWNREKRSTRAVSQAISSHAHLVTFASVHPTRAVSRVISSHAHLVTFASVHPKPLQCFLLRERQTQCDFFGGAEEGKQGAVRGPEVLEHAVFIDSEVFFSQSWLFTLGLHTSLSYLHTVHTYVYSTVGLLYCWECFYLLSTLFYVSLFLRF